MLRAFVCMALIACGGHAPAPTNAHDVSPQPSASASVDTDAGPGASVVRFDDLGLSFVVPSGFHVIGDDELTARIRASANPHLQADLQKHAAEKKGIPLLVLAKEDKDAPMNVTLSVVVVPADATPLELVSHQQTAMSENLAGFEVTAPAKELTVDNVKGAEMSTRYTDHGRKMASHVRLFVRGALATIVVVVYPDQAHAEEGTRLLDGVHFYAP